MLTEDEAKTKWCPHVRFHHSGGGVYANKPLDSADDTGHANAKKALCIASNCMAWRWSLEKPIAYYAGEPVYLSKNPNSPPRGYCGLAGKP